MNDTLNKKPVELRRAVYYDELNDETIYFKTNASDHTINGMPEIEWYHVKKLLIAFGYTVIEQTKTNLN